MESCEICKRKTKDIKKYEWMLVCSGCYEEISTPFEELDKQLKYYKKKNKIK